MTQANRAPNVFVFSYFDLGTSGVESARNVLRRILFEMKKQYGLHGVVPTNYIQIQRTFLLWLRMATAKGKVCCINMYIRIHAYIHVYMNADVCVHVCLLYILAAKDKEYLRSRVEAMVA